MFSDVNENFESDRDRVFTLIDSAFSDVKPPSDWKDYSIAEDFERELGADFFPKFWEYMYDLDPTVTKYVLPFVMKYFVLMEDRSIDDSVNLDLLLIRLDPISQRTSGSFDFYESIYNQFSSEQKKALCEWLDFLKTYKNEPFICSIEGAILYWCSNAH